MNLKTIPLGVIGVALAVAGAIGYSLAPEKLWLVAFLEGSALLCLILFFVVHFISLKAFSTHRSTRMGANSLLMILLFVGILAIVNFLAARHSIRWDLSENQNFSLAPQTHRVLRSLPHEVLVTVFTREKDPGYQSYKERLDSYRQASPKISVEFVDPERQPKIAQNYGITRTDTAIFESAGHTVRVTSPSEVELTGALIRVSQDSKKRVLFLEGHGEPSLDDRERTGLSAAREILFKQGYDVGTLSLLKEDTVPDLTAILVVAAPPYGTKHQHTGHIDAQPHRTAPWNPLRDQHHRPPDRVDRGGTARAGDLPRRPHEQARLDRRPRHGPGVLARARARRGRRGLQRWPRPDLGDRRDALDAARELDGEDPVSGRPGAPASVGRADPLGRCVQIPARHRLGAEDPLRADS